MTNEFCKVTLHVPSSKICFEAARHQESFKKLLFMETLGAKKYSTSILKNWSAYFFSKAKFVSLQIFMRLLYY